MSTPVWIRVDEDDTTLADYKALTLPAGWVLRVGPRKPLSEVYNETFKLFRGGPDWYGFIGDDVVPETPGWDTKLIWAAAASSMAVPSGSDTTGPCPHFVLGRRLPESTGWLCLPGLNRLYIDTVWHGIAKAKGAYREVPEVILSHYHFSNGKALFDRTYKKPNPEHDKRIYREWIAGQNGLLFDF